MARILSATDTGDGRVTLGVDVAADTIAVLVVPLWCHLAGDVALVADVLAARYAARRSRPREGTP